MLFPVRLRVLLVNLVPMLKTSHLIHARLAVQDLTPLFMRLLLAPCASRVNTKISVDNPAVSSVLPVLPPPRPAKWAATYVILVAISLWKDVLSASTVPLVPRLVTLAPRRVRSVLPALPRLKVPTPV